ncbi:MAG: flippase-like domain-containing protein [Candidatus Sumerlaeaceae bacterium]|nr:flippase-like domain-containing protein [Candidatus Sumerlaeaceae bacterium]
MNHPIFKRTVWILVFAVLIYTAFVIWSDFRKNVDTLKAFPWKMLPVIIACVLVNFLIRELKWDYYRRAGGIEVPRFGSFLVFFSGYSMCISPGRVGELIKPFMYKQYFGHRMSKTIPLVLCERISDLLGMIVLAGVAATAFIAGLQREADQSSFSSRFIIGFLIFSAIFMAAGIYLARHRPMMEGLIGWIRRYKRLEKPAHKLSELYESTYPLLTVKNLLITTCLAVFSWSFECIALDIILQGVGAGHVTLGQATFIFCMATIFGGFLFFLPGGIGGFEVTMAMMLGYLAVPAFQAGPAVILIRFCTLFFGVALGFVFILITSARFHMAVKWDEFEKVEADPEAGPDA